MQFRKISADEISLRPFQTLDKEWALLSAGDRDGFNTMTVSWGGMGTLWSRPVVTVYVRPQRYTREFIERAESFTLSFFGDSHRKDLGYLGKVSGRDKNKLAETALTPCFDGETGAPMFEQAALTLVCRKLYVGKFDPDRFIDTALVAENYPHSDFHSVYIGEVTGAYAHEN